MATTSPDNIKTPDAGDQYALVQDLGAMADTTQNALNRRGNMYVGTSAQRTAFPSAPEGTHWQDTNGAKWEYVKQSGAWERWVKPPRTDLTMLYSGPGIYVTSTQTAALSQTLSSQSNGIILGWSGYTPGGGAESANWNYFTVPKNHLGVPGTGVSMLGSVGSRLVRKYVYVTDNGITGHDVNGDGDNRYLVLRYVWGF